MFDLMPFGVLDGQKIFDWNKTVWGISMTAVVRVLALFICDLFSLKGSLILLSNIRTSPILIPVDQMQ
jgi:hypothetical protein